MIKRERGNRKIIEYKEKKGIRLTFSKNIEDKEERKKERKKDKGELDQRKERERGREIKKERLRDIGLWSDRE